jgi:lipopolysaccharide export system permease protein
MTRLERYLGREVLPAFLFGVALYVGLFLVQSLLARSQYLTAIPLGGALRWLAYQVPGFAVQAFPMAIVLAVLLAFGRLARENELTAVRAGGIGLARVARPLVLFAVGLVALSLLLAEFVVPAANRRTIVTWWDAVDGGGTALSRIAGRQLAVGPYQLYFGGYDASKGELRDVRLESWNGRAHTVYFAQGATLERDRLSLRGYEGHTVDYGRLSEPGATLADVVTLSNAGPDENARLAVKLPQSRDEIAARNAEEGGFDDPRSLSEWWETWRGSSGPAATTAAVELSMRTAVPFASLAILLLAVPVAAGYARSTSVAFGLSLAITLGYYLALYLGQALGLQGLVPPLAGPWLANIALIGAGIWLLRRELAG